MNNNRKIKKYAGKDKDKFIDTSMISSYSMQQGKPITLVFKDIDTLLQFFGGKYPLIQR